MPGSVHGNAALERALTNTDSQFDEVWRTSEIASFITHPGVGRVLCIGDGNAELIPEILRGAQYQVGKLGLGLDEDALARAASTFLPDLIYVSLAGPDDLALEALETLAHDPRTRDQPLIALVPEGAPASVVEEAYSRTGCDFFRLGHTTVELLARTHMLVKLSRPRHQLVPTKALSPTPRPSAANDTNVLTLRDPNTGLYSSQYFLHRLSTEISRARRHERPLSLVVIECPQALDDGAVNAQVGRVLLDLLRDTDVCTSLQEGMYVALLPETESEKLDTFESRVCQRLLDKEIACRIGRAGLDDVEVGTHSPASLLDRARAVLEA